jgi:hypothetical protein
MEQVGVDHLYLMAASGKKIGVLVDDLEAS